MKGSSMTSRKPHRLLWIFPLPARSPLHGVTVHEIEMLREAVMTSIRWERRIPHGVVSRPSFYSAKSINGLSDLTFYGKQHNRAFDRTFSRLRERTDSATIQRNMDDARFRDKNPAAYELKLLRAQLKDGAVTPESLDRALGRVQRTVKS